MSVVPVVPVVSVVPVMPVMPLAVEARQHQITRPLRVWGETPALAVMVQTLALQVAVTRRVVRVIAVMVAQETAVLPLAMVLAGGVTAPQAVEATQEMRPVATELPAAALPVADYFHDAWPSAVSELWLKAVKPGTTSAATLMGVACSKAPVMASLTASLQQLVTDNPHALPMVSLWCPPASSLSWATAQPKQVHASCTP